MTDPMPRDLDRLLAAATVPVMSAGLIDRIVAEAERPGRAVFPPLVPQRSAGRRWTRRGVRGGIVAVGLMLATAVAAAFGGGALSVAQIRAVARHVVEHLRNPFPHAPAAPVRPVVRRLHVPQDAIRVVPYAAMPSGARGIVARPMPANPPVDRGPGAIERDHPRPERFARPRPSGPSYAAARVHRFAGHPARMGRGMRWQMPRIANGLRGRFAEGSRGARGDRFGGLRWHDPARLGGAGPRGFGWRRMPGYGGGFGGPRWPRGGGFGGAGSGRMRPFRSPGGRGRRR